MIFLADGLSPGNDQARDWARDELSDQRYQPDTSSGSGFADTLWRWLGNLFGDIVGSGTHVPAVIAIVLGIAVLALIVYALRFVRRTRSAPKQPAAPVLGADAPSAKELRKRAEELWQAGDYDGCVRESMRAVTRRADERGLLTDAPSLTAYEVSRRLGRTFPEFAPRLQEAATLFDATMYGNRHADAQRARSLLDLEADLADSSPQDAESDSAATEFVVPR